MKLKLLIDQLVRNRINLGILLISALLVSSCSRRVTPVTSRVVDSTYTTVQTKLRDTVVSIGADSVFASLSLEELPEFSQALGQPPVPIKILQKHGKASIQLTKIGTTVTGICFCDSLEKRVRLQDQLITVLNKRFTTTTEVVKEQFIPKFTLYMSYFGMGVLVLLIIYLLLKFILPKWHNLV